MRIAFIGVSHFHTHKVMDALTSRKDRKVVGVSDPVASFADKWAATLGAEIKRAQDNGDPDTGETYYRHWLSALERLVAEKGVADARTLARYRDAWDHAADRTPHGMPIELRPDDFS